jgi:hypothetical protein
MPNLCLDVCSWFASGVSNFPSRPPIRELFLGIPDSYLAERLPYPSGRVRHRRWMRTPRILQHLLYFHAFQPGSTSLARICIGGFYLHADLPSLPASHIQSVEFSQLARAEELRKHQAEKGGRRILTRERRRFVSAPAPLRCDGGDGCDGGRARLNPDWLEDSGGDSSTESTSRGLRHRAPEKERTT